MREDNEFRAFMKGESEPSRELDAQIKGKIARDLKSLPWRVFSKALALHWLAGALTLLVCPQFGWSPFRVSSHLPHIFMEYGMWACGLFCGTLFVLFGALATRFFASGNERLVLARKSFHYAFALSGISLGILMFFGRLQGGAEVYFGFQFITFWIVGAVALDLLFFKVAMGPKVRSLGD